MFLTSGPVSSDWAVNCWNPWISSPSILPSSKVRNSLSEPPCGAARRINSSGRALTGLTLAGFRLMRAHHQQGFPCCHVFHLADKPTPLPRWERSGAPVAFLPKTTDGLPLISGGSVPTTAVSRSAQRSQMFRPACTLSRPRRLFNTGASIYIVTSVNCLGCYQPKRQLLGGIRAHQENAPFHGALRKGR